MKEHRISQVLVARGHAANEIGPEQEPVEEEVEREAGQEVLGTAVGAEAETDDTPVPADDTRSTEDDELVFVANEGGALVESEPTEEDETPAESAGDKRLKVVEE
jgi:hypothetical protein